MLSHIDVVQFPLPTPRKGETLEDIRAKGMEIGLKLLHDPDIMIKNENLGCSFKSIERTHEKAVDVSKLALEFGMEENDSDDLASWRHYEVTENIPIAFGITKQITFYTALRFNDDGMEALSNPGSSVTIHGQYVLAHAEADHKYLELTETTQMRSPAFLAWYIKSTLVKAHEKVNAYVKEKFVEAMRGKTWA